MKSYIQAINNLAKKKIVQGALILVIILSVVQPQVVSSEEVGSEVLTPAQIFAQALFSSKSYPVSGEREPVRKRTMFATAYSSDPWQTDATPFVPASGVDYRNEYKKYHRTFAIASNDLPLGTRVKIPELFGNDILIVHDRMNARYTGKGRLDIYMYITDEEGNYDADASRNAARTFGAKSVVVEIF